MVYSRRGGRRIGRIVTDAERAARIRNEAAGTIPDEILRSSFAISERFMLTAWHAIRREHEARELLWFRFRRDSSDGRKYIYLPVRVTNYDEMFDVAALALEPGRLAAANISPDTAAEWLREMVIPLGADVRVEDHVQVMGFPANHTGADSDTNSARVVATDIPMGETSGLKLFGDAFAAANPLDPHGMSGGPVLRTSGVQNEGAFRAVAIIRAAPRGSMIDAAAGGGLIATRVEDVADCLPEIGMAVPEVRVRATPQLLSLTRDANVAEVFAACGRYLQETLLQVHDPGRGDLTGWPHFFNEPVDQCEPTAIGTAYGLKLAAVLGEQCHQLDRSALVETLWRLRRPDGGWAARTGMGIGRPEVSALVVGTLAMYSDRADRVASAAEQFEDCLLPGRDPVVLERTYVLTSVIRGLIRTNPHSAQMGRLRGALLTGAIKDPAHGNLTCWPEQMVSDRHMYLPPSVTHTSQAIITLIRLGRVLNDDSHSRAAVHDALRWLAAQHDLSEPTEHIRRAVPDNPQRDPLTVKHFTAGWVARALLLAPPDIPGAETALMDAVRKVWGAYRDGYWVWNRSERPIWMAYQSACVLRDFALRTSSPL